MDTKTHLTTLARQIDTAKSYGSLFIGDVLRTLRVTYVALASGIDPWKDASHLFLVTVSPAREPILIQAHHPVPVNAPYLSSLFRTAGVDLVPGQVLLLDPALAKEVIEEALGVIGIEQALAGQSDPLWEKKIELVAASLVAEEYLERVRALNGSGEAA